VDLSSVLTRSSSLRILITKDYFLVCLLVGNSIRWKAKNNETNLCLLLILWWYISVEQRDQCTISNFFRKMKKKILGTNFCQDCIGDFYQIFNFLLMKYFVESCHRNSWNHLTFEKASSTDKIFLIKIYLTTFVKWNLTENWVY
jgi:hypothetical protein